MNRKDFGKAIGAVLLVALAVLAFRLNRGAPLAVVVEMHGDLERDFADATGAWVEAGRGDELRLGDGVQTGEGSTASLRLDGGGELRMQPDTVIRFSSQQPKADQAAFDVKLGAVRFQAGEQAKELITRFGAITIESGASVALSPADAALHVVVEIGRVVVGGRAAGVGSTIVIELGGVKIETPAPRGEAPPVRALEPVRATVVGSAASLQGEAGQQALPEGEHTLPAETRLALGSETTVTLAQRGRRATLVGAGSFIVAPAPGVLVAAEAGMLRVAQSAPVRIDVPGGSIFVAERGDVEVDTSSEGTEVSVASESAKLSAGGVSQTIRPGQGARIVPGGELTLRGVGLPYADLELSTGKSVRIHDPQPPSVVRFSYPGKCVVGTGVVELLRGRTVERYGVAEGYVSLSVAAGRTKYQVRCLQPDGRRSAVVERGSVEVIADRATRRMPSRAPVTRLVADGRHYTVLYQSKLPVVHLSWPAPPAAERYQLVHGSPKGRAVVELTAPEHRFESGQLVEGKHTFYFEASGKLSRRSSVSIAFDNASPAVRLTTPPVVRAETGQAMRVAGVALPGSKVAVDGKAVRVDRQGRFRVAVPLQTKRRAVAVNIVHPRLGERVYLRRAESP